MLDRVTFTIPHQLSHSFIRNYSDFEDSVLRTLCDNVFSSRSYRDVRDRSMQIIVFSLILFIDQTFGWSRPFFSTSPNQSEPSAIAAKVRIEFAAEFLLMVIGRHGYFVDSLLRPVSYDDAHIDAQVDKDHHLSAMAIVQMLQRLPLMERVDALLNSTVAEVINATTDYPTVVNAIYDKLAMSMANDTLAEEFAKTKEQMQTKWDSLLPTRKRYSAYRAPQSIQSLRTLMWNLASDHPDIKKLLICTSFLDARNSTIAHHVASVNGTLNLSKMPAVGQEVERIFKDALDEFVEEQPLSDPETIIEVFLSKLNNKLKEDRILNSRLSSGR